MTVAPGSTWLCVRRARGPGQPCPGRRSAVACYVSTSLRAVQQRAERGCAGELAPPARRHADIVRLAEVAKLMDVESPWRQRPGPGETPSPFASAPRR